MAQGRSTKIITMVKWIRTSRLSIKNFLSETPHNLKTLVDCEPSTGLGVWMLYVYFA